MQILGFLSEGLLQVLYRIAWAAFWAQGSAFALAFMMFSAGWASAPWAVLARRSALILGGIFVAGGVLLFLVSLKSRFTTGVTGPDEAAPNPASRSALLAVSLLALSAAAVVASRELLSLWREIIVLLEQAGIFRELPAGGMGSGLVFAPLMVILYTPILSAFAAAALIALPVLLAIVFVARSPRSRALFTGAVICCAVLVGAGLVAADLFERLTVILSPTLRGDKDPMGAHVADELQRGVAVLLRTGRAQGIVLLAHLAWLPFAFMSTRAARGGDAGLSESPPASAA